MTEAIAAFGTIVHCDVGGGGMVPIAQLRDIAGPNLTLATEDVTPQDAAGGWVQRVPTLLDGGEVTFMLNFLPTDDTQDAQGGLIRDMLDKTLRDFMLVWPEVTEWDFSAYVVGFKPTAPVAGGLTADVILLNSGEMSLD